MYEDYKYKKYHDIDHESTSSSACQEKTLAKYRNDSI